MKPCRKNRKRITWLALGALESAQELTLRAHFETCAGCRRYLEEISSLAVGLETAETETDIATSESFHRRVLSALAAEEPAGKEPAPLLHWLWNWRVAVPALCATAGVICVLLHFVQRPGASLSGTTTVHVVAPTSHRQVDLLPTLANYEMVANRSFDQFDELLTRQANRNLPPAPSYLASSLLSETSTK